MDTRLQLEAADIGLVVVAEDDRLPEVLHWGRALGPLDEAAVRAIALGTRHRVAPNLPDLPPRYGILLEGRHGWRGKPGLVGSRQGRDWTPDWRLEQVLLDGDPVEGFVSSGPCTIDFLARCDLSELSLRLTLQLTEQGLVRLRGAVTNDGDEPFEVDELTLAMPVPNRATELLDFAGRWGAERWAQRSPFAFGQHRREGRHGRTGHDAAFVLHAGVPGFGYRCGEVWGVHTAWSGNHVTLAERDQVGVQLLAGGELLLPGEGLLARGESYISPWVWFNHGDGLDAQADRFHGWLRSRPHAPSSDRPVTLNVWEAVYFDHRADRLIDLAERAASLGVERYVLDDGWFAGRRDDTAGLGDWVVSPDVWPDGLHPLVDRVHELGMQFGLWFEPEMVNPDSDLARAHPEWIMQPEGRLPVENRHQQVLNLAIGGAWRHVYDQMHALLDEYRIDYIKWDHNRDLIDAGGLPGGAPAVAAHTRAYYRLLDALREAHPHVEWESCASGGGRVDLEVAERVERVWVSDVIDPEERQRMLPWTGQLLPPEFLGSHIASGRSEVTGRLHELSFRAATAVFGHLGIEWDLAEATQDELGQLRWWIDWYKANRHVLCGGRQVRVDMPLPNCWFKGMVTPDKAIFSLCHLESAPTMGLGMLRFPGLDVDSSYRVRVLEREQWTMHAVPWELAGPVVVPGRVLVEVGLQAPQLRPSSAVIVELERV